MLEPEQLKRRAADHSHQRLVIGHHERAALGQGQAGKVVGPVRPRDQRVVTVARALDQLVVRGTADEEVLLGVHHQRFGVARLVRHRSCGVGRHVDDGDDDPRGRELQDVVAARHPNAAVRSDGEAARPNRDVRCVDAYVERRRGRGAVAGERGDAIMREQRPDPMVPHVGDVHDPVGRERESAGLIELALGREAPVTTEAGVAVARDALQVPRRQPHEHLIERLVRDEEQAVRRGHHSRWLLQPDRHHRARGVRGLRRRPRGADREHDRREECAQCRDHDTSSPTPTCGAAPPLISLHVTVHWVRRSRLVLSHR